MALMSNPDPIPVEVISALAVVGGALDALLGDMTELIGFCVRALRCPIYRQPLPVLKQAAYQKPVADSALNVLIDDNAGNTDAARQCGELAGWKFTNYFAGSGIDLLDELVIGRRIHAKLIWLA